MKVLIISHNCISNNNNMGKALLSVVSNFKKEELCQLYIYPSIPDIDICNSYYRVTDKEQLKSIYTFKKYGKEIDKKNINAKNILFENEKDKKIYMTNRNVQKKIVRDIVWNLSNPLNDNLKQWLNKEKPTHILIFPGKSCFFYDFAIKIKKYLNIPLITYFTDNYYGLKGNNLLEKRYQKKLEKKILNIINSSNCLITVSSMMSDFYSNKFKRIFYTIMLGSDIKINNIKNVDEIENISYIGNMSNKRYNNLAEIGKALDRINRNYKKKYKLNIFSNIYDENILKMFEPIESINYCGFVKGDKYIKAVEEADIFVHVESFDENCIDLVKYSISTKISENITSGKCLLAYGPNNVASMNYLIDNEAAYFIDKKGKLDEKINDLLNNKILREKIIQNGFIAAKKDLNCKNNSKILYDIIKKI